MAVYKKANKLRKLRQSLKKYEANNPEMAHRIKNRIAFIEKNK